MKKRYAIMFILCAAIFLSACQKESNSVMPIKQAQEDDSLTIGFSMATFKEERWLRDRDIFVAKAQEAGFKVIVKNANNDSSTQYNQVEDMLNEGINVLVIAPHDAEDALRIVELSHSKGVPIISYDRMIKHADIDAYVSFDNVMVGKLMANALVDEIQNGNLMILNGSPNDYNSTMFHEGYFSVLKPLIENGDITIVAETWVDDWRRETAYDYCYSKLSEEDLIPDGIIAANDSLARAAIDALLEKRLIDHVKVVGHDADLAACRRIVSNNQLMTVYKPISVLVDKTIGLCQVMVKGEEIESNETIDNGGFNVPYIKIDVIEVNAKNIDQTIIKSGFHLKEDIYQD